MGFLKACVLSTLLMLNTMSWVRAAARPTPDASTAKLDSNTWGEMLVSQPTRIGSPISHDNDYMNLQTLLTKNIPGTPEEKSRVVDLMLQLLAEIDLPTLCEVIANDTNRKVKNFSRDVKTFERSTEAPEIMIPSMKTRQRSEDAAPFAIPYFNILGQSNNAIPEKDTEQPPTVSKGLSHESITRYHRNMVERVNKGMNAMREYGNKRRAAYFNGIRRNQNVMQAQFNANIPTNTMSQVDEVNELKNLHAEERSADSITESWKTQSVDVNGEEIAQTNSSDAIIAPTESNNLNRALGLDDGLATRNIWIQSMNVERPNSELYSQSLLNRDHINRDPLHRHNSIDGDESMKAKERKWSSDEILGDRSRSNLLKRLSWTEDKLIGDAESQSGIMGNKQFPQVSKTVKSGIIFGGSDIYNTNDINDDYPNRNLDKYNVFNSINGMSASDMDFPTEETIAENNFVNMATSKTTEESNDISFQPETPTDNINFTHNTFSTLQVEGNFEGNQTLTDSNRNKTFESVQLGRRSDSSIDDFFGANSDAGRFVNLPENNNLHKVSPVSSSLTSTEVNATEKITYAGENYLTNVLSEVLNANSAETQATHRAEKQANDSSTTPNFSGEKMRISPVGHESVNMANSSDNLTRPVWMSSTTSHNKEGNTTLSEIRNNTSYVPLNTANEDAENAKTLSRPTNENNFVMYDEQVNNETNVAQEIYNHSSNSQILKRDYKHKNKTALNFIQELDKNASSLSSRISLINLVKSDSETTRALNESESVDRDRQHNDTNSNTFTPSVKNAEVNDKSSANMQNATSTNSTGLNAQNTDASPVFESSSSTTPGNSSDINATAVEASSSTTPGNSSGINATAVDAQEYHISRGAVPYNKLVQMNSSESYVRYEPATGLEHTEQSLQMFGPYGNGQGKALEKNDVVVADVVSATPEMSIESAKADLEKELKKLSRDVSTQDKDFISIMRGNQRGIQRGVSSTAYQNFLAQPVMKSLKRIHEFRQRGNSQNVTDDAVSRASEVSKLVEAPHQNSTYNESSILSETPGYPAYNITQLGLEDLKQNVTISTNIAKKENYTNPDNDQARNVDNLQDIFNRSLTNPSQVNSLASGKEQINETSTTVTNSSGFSNFLTEKIINTIKSSINKLSTNNTRRNDNVSEIFANSTLMNTIGLNSSRDTERERMQRAESNNMTDQSQPVNAVTRIPQQEINVTEANQSNYFVTDDSVNSSLSYENALYSNSASMNQTLILFSSETVSTKNASEDMSDNTTSEVTDAQTESYSVLANTTATDMLDVDGNATDSDSVSNNTQTSGDFLRYFLTMPTAKAGDHAGVDSGSFYDSIQNTVDDADEQKEEQLWRSYGSDFSKYLNSKRQFKDLTSLHDYQNELMKYNDEQKSRDPIRQTFYKYPNLKLAVKPESSPFLAQDFYKDSSKSSKFRQVDRVNPWKAFNIELGKEKVKHQKEALDNFHYPSFKIRHHDDVIIPSVKEYLWNARPWPKHEKTFPSNNGKYRSGFSKVKEYLREKEREMDFSPLLAEHTKLWGNRFSQGYYGRVLDEQTHAPIMTSYLNFPGELASHKTVDANARNFMGFKAADQGSISSPQTQRTDPQKDAAEKSLPTLSSNIPVKLIKETNDIKLEPSFGLPKESDVSSLTRRSDTNPNAAHNSLPGYSMIPPGPTGVPANDDFKCPGLFGYYTDPENCSSFFVCSWGASYRLQCSEGTLWNSADSVCDWAANVSCDHRKPPQ